MGRLAVLAIDVGQRGEGVHEVVDPWTVARGYGLTRANYGRTWRVYESMADYRNALD